ncbi:type II toxin-antitoxin system Phd/YefM family antitoxin [Deinococcus sp. YIM 134068]|uniref:type II toxin-antitoxin system Phd/YefM family antitoxin n=1 Tax=Deinococcus lichenicola TaxID=3118910 RepID=UPI002F9591AA
MTAYSIKYAKENLERIAQEAVDNDQATYITLDSGEAVVIVPKERYESWNETDYLLSNPANRRHLLASIEQYRQGQVVRKSLEELEDAAQ